ncbi:ribosome-inactivating family protein [Denitrobaculum tricleocarpae]|uniref:rRNA N-glycosidase n=1 Tax=Denitrobaculum tricleocarpae TaxID=2591009 RepID=A0A545U2B0_9PROT|nr:ribosome-inactivating family protein [Denitrobaculum tricleocarpae]TQV83611.1 hypothetical protein FKG95_03195 [Denitrobaculum tricleocarpae]
MTKHEYRAIMVGIGQAMTVVKEGVGRVPIGHDGIRAWSTVTVAFWGERIELLIDAKNLYLQGFKNKANDWFIFKDIGAQGIVNPTGTIGYGTDYGALGLDRNGQIRLTRTDLGNALNTLYNYDKGKEQDTLKTPMWQCAVGLIEALRFRDVLHAVASEQAFDGSLLDWDRRTKDGDANVQVKLV